MPVVISIAKPVASVIPLTEAWANATAGDRLRPLEIVQVLYSAKYLAREPATFTEGDGNGDSVFDQADVVTALAFGVISQMTWRRSLKLHGREWSVGDQS